MKELAKIKRQILGCEISDYSYEEILQYVENCIENNKRLNLTYVNAHLALLVKKNPNFQKLLNSFFIYTDGIGIFCAKRMLLKEQSFRTVATDLNSLILELADKRKFRVFFFGGSVQACIVLRDKLKSLFPSLCVTGIMSREIQINDELIEKLNASESDILFVGLGTARQEEWIVQNEVNVNIPVKIAVGSGIDYLAGTYKRAPKIMQRVGLEWLFRLIYDPRRLWRRYILGLPHFIYLVAKDYIKAGK
ncbi:MAG: WecB/TagA/CpsF family glycosyltransferase, partial [Bacteroidota bacterium]